MLDLERVYKKFWVQSSRLIDLHREAGDERAAQGVVDCRILMHRLVEEEKLNIIGCNTCKHGHQESKKCYLHNCRNFNKWEKADKLYPINETGLEL